MEKNNQDTSKIIHNNLLDILLPFFPYELKNIIFDYILQNVNFAFKIDINLPTEKIFANSYDIYILQQNDLSIYRPMSINKFEYIKHWKLNYPIKIMDVSNHFICFIEGNYMDILELSNGPSFSRYHLKSKQQKNSYGIKKPQQLSR